ncbi:hypothetical protein HGA88_04035 [Candidatus Roizmanbacteria bacterium]|nr:hypothetical protein [Candidatus Roizmanbacteria bacterium]
MSKFEAHITPFPFLNTLDNALLRFNNSKIIFSILIVLSIFLTVPSSHFVFAELTPISITVNKDNEITTIPELAFGMNMAIFDRYATDVNLPNGPYTSDLLKDIKPAIVRWPGGTYSDAFHWKGDPGIRITNDYGDTNIIYYAPDITTPDVINEVNGIGSQMMITVNYGTGTAQEAADWVEYSNITHNQHIRYWEIGNETYADGTYSGWNWEPNSRTEKGPTAYGVNALDYISKMKAVDPTIKIGIVLDLTQGNADNGICSATECLKKWNHDVLTAQRVTENGTEILGEKADFVVIHWYPECPKIPNNPWCTDGENDASLLEKVGQIENIVSRLKDQIAEYVPSRPNIPIFVTETNSVSQDPGKQTVSLVNAMFLADSYMAWLKSGVANVDWWVLHAAFEPNNNNSNTLFGDATFGNLGMIASEPYKGISSPTANTPFPPYYGFKMLQILGSAGDKIISSTSQNSLITTHAVKQSNGNIAVLIINKDPTNSYSTTISLPGYNANSSARVYTYDKTNALTVNTAVPIKQSSLTQTNSTFNYTVTPYSLNTLVFAPYVAPTSTPTPTITPSPTAQTTQSPTPTSGPGSVTASSSVTPSPRVSQRSAISSNNPIENFIVNATEHLITPSLRKSGAGVLTKGMNVQQSVLIVIVCVITAALLFILVKRTIRKK